MVYIQCDQMAFECIQMHFDRINCMYTHFVPDIVPTFNQTLFYPTGDALWSHMILFSEEDYEDGV